MAYKCDNCNKGKEHGHMVSHAKNRLTRLFLPNLQKLKVLKNGIVIRVKFCTSCIKRLRKDGIIGKFALLKIQVPSVAKSTYRSVVKSVKKELKISAKSRSSAGLNEKKEKARETMDIASIVGKKS